MQTSGRACYACWVLACAAAEAIGMTASAAAARIGQDLTDGATGAPVLAFLVVIAGGLVEGTALGMLQGWALDARWPLLHRGWFLVTTLAVAGVGWAAASAPSVLSGDDGGSGPPLGLMLLGAFGLGLVMGPVLGGAQALVLRGVTPHPWRWIVANTVAWPLAMVVIFLGASAPGESWTLLAVAGCGTLTGAVAGTVLGAVSGAWLGSLDGPPIGNRLTLAMVAGKHLGMQRRVVGLALTGRRTGHLVRLPVQYAELGQDLVVVPGHHEHKTWWRNVTAEDTALWVLDGGGWHIGVGRLLGPADDGHAVALAAYQQRWPRFAGPVDQPVVVLHLVGPGIPAVSPGL